MKHTIAKGMKGKAFLIQASVLAAVLAVTYMFFVAKYVWQAPQCSTTDGVISLCLKPVNGSSLTRGWGTRVAAKYIGDRLYEVYAFAIWSPNPWYRIDDAVKYLRSKGYNVSVGDLDKFTVLLAVEVKVLKPVRTVLPFKLNNITTSNLTTIYGEERNYAVSEKVLVLGNPDEGVFYALKLRGNRIVGAARLGLVLVNHTIRRHIDNSSCISLEDFVRKHHINRTVEELEALEVPEKLCNEGVTVVDYYKLRPIDGDLNISRVYVGVLGRSIDVLDYLWYSAYKETAKIMSGAAKSVAKMTVWWAGRIPVHVRDESYCKVEWWAYFLGIWIKKECDHAAFIAPINGVDSAHVECFGKFYYIAPLAASTFCASAELDASMGFPVKACHHICGCGEVCPCPSVNKCSCRYACDPCYGCSPCTIWG